MSQPMTKEKREAFLAKPHVAVLALGDRGRGPLAVPVWYFYEPGGEIVFLTPRNSRKGKLLAEGRRIGLCVQKETPPYRYVSVEGPVVAISTADAEEHLRPLAVRYLGETDGNAYADSMAPALADGSRILVHMAAERWLSADYS